MPHNGTNGNGGGLRQSARFECSNSNSIIAPAKAPAGFENGHHESQRPAAPFPPNKLPDDALFVPSPPEDDPAELSSEKEDEDKDEVEPVMSRSAFNKTRTEE